LLIVDQCQYRLGSMNICLRGYVKRYGFAAKAHHKPQLLWYLQVGSIIIVNIAKFCLGFIFMRFFAFTVTIFLFAQRNEQYAQHSFTRNFMQIFGRVITEIIFSMTNVGFYLVAKLLALYLNSSYGSLLLMTMDCQVDKDKHFRHRILFNINQGSKAGKAA
ncbi:hypothetical protein T10_7411, partial [Trichinella papuae]